MLLGNKKDVSLFQKFESIEEQGAPPMGFSFLLRVI